MPHKCVICGMLFDDDSATVMRGCTCGCKVFQFVRRSCPDVHEIDLKRLLSLQESSETRRREAGIHTIDVEGLLNGETLKRKDA